MSWHCHLSVVLLPLLRCMDYLTYPSDTVTPAVGWITGDRMGSGRHRTLLGLLIEQHPWTHQEFVSVFNTTAQELGESISLSPRQLARWLAGGVVSGPMPAARRVLRHLFGRTAEELLAPPSAAVRGSDRRISERDWVMAAAHQSRDHAMDSTSIDVSAAALENMYDDIVRLARDYHSTPPAKLLSEALRIRNSAYRLLEQARRPARISDLYWIAGHACALMASASFDLGYPNAAEDQARAAHAYAELIAFSPLAAWCRGLQAEAAYWTGAPRRALGLVNAALDRAPQGTPRVRLYSIKARALAYFGDGAASEVADAVQCATAEREEESRPDRLHDEVGGHFSFDSARQARCEATTYVQLGDGRSAERAAERAISLYRSTGDSWRLINLEVHADLAAARVLSGQLDGVEEALTNIWPVPPEERREGLTHRVQQVGKLLTSRYRDVATASSLADQIDDFVAASVVKALPNGSGR